MPFFSRTRKTASSGGGYASLRNTLQSGERTSNTGWKELLLGFQAQSLGLFVIATAFLLYYVALPLDEGHISSGTTRNVTQPPANLHLLIPASKQDVNLCKVLLSAAVLGYPSPIIINWNQTFNDGAYVEGGSHLAKISGVHEYVSSLDDTHDEDLVLMVDGYDIWLQLRPQTLIHRYFDINRRADQRIQAELGSVATKNHIRQEIIFGCQKRCWPWTPDDPPCYAVPNSTLPSDIYGPRTDTPGAEFEYPYLNYRPRFLNSGAAMGTVRAMRKMFEQALAQTQVEKNIGSDQYIFSHIYGDQEIWREALRRDSLTAASHLANKVKKPHAKAFFNPAHLKEVQAKASLRADGNFEFGIGVDHGSEIVLNTVFAEEDTAWLTATNISQLEAANTAHDITPANSRLRDFAKDIAATLPPFWTWSAEDLPRWTKWEEIPLFTNVYTGIQPAIIHHNAHRDGLKSLRETWWPLVWFQSHARTLYTAEIYAPLHAIATAGYDKRSVKEWWPYEMWKGGGRNGISEPGSFGEGWIKFDDICRECPDELFRDGLGPWELPENH